jgi:hypothetical protein
VRAAGGAIEWDVSSCGATVRLYEWGAAVPAATTGRVGVVAPGPGSFVNATVTPSPGGTVNSASQPSPSPPTLNDPIGAGAWLPTIAQAS